MRDSNGCSTVEADAARRGLRKRQTDEEVGSLWMARPADHRVRRAPLP